jgi:hypothetical protein
VSFFYSKAFLINCFLQHLKLMLYGACWFIRSFLGYYVVATMKRGIWFVFSKS